MENKIIIFFFFIFNFNLYSMDFYDSLNRKITLKKRPEKIIALGPGALRIISYLNSIDKIIATENIEIKFAKEKPYSLVFYDYLKKLPIVSEGGPDKTPDYEKIILLKPDLIITCSLDLQTISQIEAKTKIKVFAIDYSNIGTFDIENFKNVLNKLGDILDKKERAKYLTKQMDNYVLDLNKRIKNIKDKPSVYVGGIGFKGSHGITSTQFLYPSFEFLGLKSIIDLNDSKAIHTFIDKEKIIKFNPQYIFIDILGLPIIYSDYKLNKKFYEILNSFKNLNVYTILPYNYYATNIEIIFMNTYFIGKVLFPDNFLNIDIDKKNKEIFKVFLNKDLYDEFTKYYGYKKLKSKKFDFGKI